MSHSRRDKFGRATASGAASANPCCEGCARGAGAGGVGVTATSGCEWTAESNANWITITSGERYTGNATVTYNVSANTTGSKRVGMITIAGQTFTVKQKG